MAITQTANYLLSKFEKFDVDWDAGFNQNFDDIDTILSRLDQNKQVLHAQHTATAGADGGDLALT